MAVDNNFQENKDPELARNEHNIYGHMIAQFNLGRCYYFRIGPDKKISEAFKYDKLSAANGYTRAQYILGIFYYYGTSCERNINKGIEYLKLAANQGYNKAHEFLVSTELE